MLKEEWENQGNSFGDVVSWWTHWLWEAAHDMLVCSCILVLLSLWKMLFLACHSVTVTVMHHSACVTRFCASLILALLFRLVANSWRVGFPICLSQQSWDWPLWKLSTVEGMWIRLEREMSGQMLNLWFFHWMWYADRLQAGTFLQQSHVGCCCRLGGLFLLCRSSGVLQCCFSLQLFCSHLKVSLSCFFWLTFKFLDLDHGF